MIVVTVTLISAVTHKHSELGHMVIYNDGTSDNPEIGNYVVKLARKHQTLGSTVSDEPLRSGEVKGHRRQALSIWALVSKALKAVRF